MQKECVSHGKYSWSLFPRNSDWIRNMWHLLKAWELLFWLCWSSGKGRNPRLPHSSRARTGFARQVPSLWEFLVTDRALAVFHVNFYAHYVRSFLTGYRCIMWVPVIYTSWEDREGQVHHVAAEKMNANATKKISNAWDREHFTKQAPLVHSTFPSQENMISDPLSFLGYLFERHEVYQVAMNWKLQKSRSLGSCFLDPISSLSTKNAPGEADELLPCKRRIIP